MTEGIPYFDSKNYTLLWIFAVVTLAMLVAIAKCLEIMQRPSTSKLCVASLHAPMVTQGPGLGGVTGTFVARQPRVSAPGCVGSQRSVPVHHLASSQNASLG